MTLNSPAQAAEEEALVLEEIVVTAQRRAQGLQEVPIAVSAFSETEMEARQITETLDIMAYVPNMVASNNTGLGTANTYFMRGLGNTESIATFDPPIGTYINDIYISRQNANNFSFFDVERVEVLRGPQGTLFGRNTTGGAVNIILKRPGEEMAGFAEAGYGRFDRVSFRGAVDLPVSDKVLTKFSAYYVDDDGFVDNVTTGETLNDETSWGLYGAARILISENATWDASVSYMDSNKASILNFVDPDTGDRVSRTGLSSAGTGLDLVRGPKNDLPLGNRTDTLILTSSLQLDYEGVNIEFLTGYVDLHQDFLLDFLDGPVSYGGFTIVNIGDHEQFSQEIKLNGTLGGDKLDYVVGLYYLDENNVVDFADIFDVGFPLVLADRILSNSTEAWAAYGQFDYHLSEQLTATAGVRYTDEDKTIGYVDNRGGGLTTEAMVAAGIPVRQNAKVWTPRFVLDYSFDEDISVFVSATRGFKSGGWNARGTTAVANTPFDPEKIWSYEAGLRSELLDRRLRLNVTAFYSDISELQVVSGVDVGGGNIQFLTDNFADMDVKGVEAELYWLVAEGLSIYSTVGLMDAEYTNIDPSVLAQQAACQAGDVASCNRGIVNPRGDISEPSRTPDVTLNLGFTYEVPVNALKGRIISTANMRYMSEHFVNTSNPDVGLVDNRLLFNGGISYVTDDDRWTVSAECRNCFGEEYVHTVLIVPYLNDPATWSLRVKYKFGDD
ncbi:TonB-dependent receptor [Luteithermobacter gelatinilyticus]|uniref:TonB-dependent receptor n=1 Tax=Luteithermobacter gelatinilyticus TaxID=2582913 RepID=UPI00143D6C58|nr:TonB-dependent receptor [Luteithermobacter gelatinilyticus]